MQCGIDCDKSATFMNNVYQKVWQVKGRYPSAPPATMLLNMSNPLAADHALGVPIRDGRRDTIQRVHDVGDGAASFSLSAKFVLILETL